MKKLVSFALAMLFALSVVVSGCSKDEHKEKEKTPASTEKKDKK